ncbi:hypothetical protein C5167_035688 [Papaver somniferum]|nr:hypothetical protein C5167_035688 [Papaver somniferum]
MKPLISLKVFEGSRRLMMIMRPVFCGSFDYETRQSDLERLFSKYGTVDRVDMKSGYEEPGTEDGGISET